MASLAVSSNFFAVNSYRESLIVVKPLEEPKTVVLELPNLVNAKEVSNDSESGCDSVTSDVSSSGRYFAVSSGKKLIVWNTDDWSLSSSRVIQRAASSIKFTPKENQIVVADKSGDVYLFSLSNEEPGQLILGHLSVILDVQITSDEKFIITCDRDEKIRVSNFPNAYNIHCFCLGHKEFVSSIRIVPHDERLLVSGSGDNTIRCWDFSKGSELSCYELTSLPSATEVANTNNSLAVDSIVIFKRDEKSSLICIKIPFLLKITVLILQQSEDSVTIKFYSFIDTHSNLIDFAVTNKHLLILSENKDFPLSLLQWSSDEDTFLNQQDFIDKLFVDLKVDLKKHITILKKQESIDYLYKKKYDCVQEYLLKKKARVEATQ